MDRLEHLAARLVVGSRWLLLSLIVGLGLALKFFCTHLMSAPTNAMQVERSLSHQPRHHKVEKIGKDVGGAISGNGRLRLIQ